MVENNEVQNCTKIKKKKVEEIFIHKRKTGL